MKRAHIDAVLRAGETLAEMAYELRGRIDTEQRIGTSLSLDQAYADAIYALETEWDQAADDLREAMRKPMLRRTRIKRKKRP